MAAARKTELHPEEERRQLAHALEQELLPGYLIRGEERYYRDKALALIQAASAKREWELCPHDAGDPEFNLSALLDDLTGGALFASARLVVMHRISPLLAKTGPKAAPALTEALKARFTSGVEGSVAISVDSLRVDNVVVKALKASGGKVVGCRRLWETAPPWKPDPLQAELVQWFYALARNNKVSLSLEEAAYVVTATGNDLYALEAQLPRLAQRGRESLSGVVGWQAGGTPYSVSDRIAAGEVARAVAALEALFSSGFHGKDGTTTLDRAGLVVMTLNALSGKARQCLIGAEALATGDSMREATKQAGVRGGPKAGGEFEQLVRLRSAGDWRIFFEEVGDLERRSRSGALVDENDLACFALRWRKVASRA